MEILELEVCVIGEISGGYEFSSNNAFASYKIESGNEWECVGGELSGQTQVCYPFDKNDIYTWNHPINLHFFTKSLQGWPRIILEVYNLDGNGLRSLLGYGFGFIPTIAGHHQVEISIWRPIGTHQEEIDGYFLNRFIELQSNDPIYKKAKDERFRLDAIGNGKVILDVDVVLRNFNRVD